LISQADSLIKPLIIDESFLFIVMYTDALDKVLSMEGIRPRKRYRFNALVFYITVYIWYYLEFNTSNTCATLAKMLIDKILNEQTINSASQAVIDEIKRTYDDKFASKYTEREDLTLVVRVFNENIKSRLIDIENQIKASKSPNVESDEVKFLVNSNDFEDPYDSLQSTYDYSLTNTNITATNMSNEQTHSSINSEGSNSDSKRKGRNSEIEAHLDENGKVIPYLKLDELTSLLELSQNKHIIDEFEAELIRLSEASTSIQSSKDDQEFDKTTRI
jgi:hypothetical protein